MDKRDFAFGKRNFLLIGVGVLIVIIGFLLMTGSASTTEQFDPDIFSFRRIKLAPGVTLFGFLFMIYGVVCKPKTPAKK